MAASSGPDVVCRAPCENSRNVVGRPTPNPTCVCPRSAPSDWVTRSWNETTLVLYPVVFRFARLLPTTSIAVESAFRAESADEKEANNVFLLGFCCCIGGTGRLVGRCCTRGGVQHPFDGIQILPHLNRLFKPAELRKLCHELGAILRIERILILQLRNQ